MNVLSFYCDLDNPLFQMAALGIHGNGDGKIVTEEDIEDTLNVLDNPLQRVSNVTACVDVIPPGKISLQGYFVT